MGSKDDKNNGNSSTPWWEESLITPQKLLDKIEIDNNWSLAGDSATTTVLKNLSDKLLEQAKKVDDALNTVCNEATDLNSSLCNTINSLEILSHTQFIESRTYQEDSIDTNSELKENKAGKVLTQDESKASQEKAVSAGVDVVEEFFEKHEIGDSDSEEDSSPVRKLIVYKRINSYRNHRLPHIIGSASFYNDATLGVYDESESTTDEEIDSSTESEVPNTEVNSKKAIVGTSSKMETDNSDSDLDASSLIAIREGDAASSSLRSVKNSVFDPSPSRTPLKDPFEDSSTSISESENHKSLKKEMNPSATVIPCFEQQIAQAVTKQGNKVSRNGASHKSSGEADEEDLFSRPPKSMTKKTKKVSDRVRSKKSLFDSSSSSDEEMHTPQRHSSGHSSINEEKENILTTKKPVGGVNLFGNAITNSINQQNLSRKERHHSGSSRGSGKVNISDSGARKTKEKKEESIKKRVTSLFSDDDDNLFIPSQERVTPAAPHLKEKITPASTKKSSIDEKKPAASQNTTGGLFADSEDLFATPVRTQSSSSIRSNKMNSSKAINVAKGSSGKKIQIPVSSKTNDRAKSRSVSKSPSISSKSTSRTPSGSKSVSRTSSGKSSPVLKPINRTSAVKAQPFASRSPPSLKQPTRKFNKSIFESSSSEDDFFSPVKQEIKEDEVSISNVRSAVEKENVSDDDLFGCPPPFSDEKKKNKISNLGSALDSTSEEENDLFNSSDLQSEKQHHRIVEDAKSSNIINKVSVIENFKSEDKIKVENSYSEQDLFDDDSSPSTEVVTQKTTIENNKLTISPNTMSFNNISSQDAQPHVIVTKSEASIQEKIFSTTSSSDDDIFQSNKSKISKAELHNSSKDSDDDIFNKNSKPNTLKKLINLTIASYGVDIRAGEPSNKATAEYRHGIVFEPPPINEPAQDAASKLKEGKLNDIFSSDDEDIFFPKPKVMHQKTTNEKHSSDISVKIDKKRSENLEELNHSKVVCDLKPEVAKKPTTVSSKVDTCAIVPSNKSPPESNQGIVFEKSNEKTSPNVASKFKEEKSNDTHSTHVLTKDIPSNIIQSKGKVAEIASKVNIIDTGTTADINKTKISDESLRKEKNNFKQFSGTKPLDLTNSSETQNDPPKLRENINKNDEDISTADLDSTDYVSRDENIESKPKNERKPVFKKPPIGGVALFGGSELLNKLKKRRPVEDDEIESIKIPSKVQSPRKLVMSKSLDLIKVGLVKKQHPTPITTRPLSLDNSEKGTSFDSSPYQHSVLPSLNKNRAKVSFKRKLPSRKKKNVNDIVEDVKQESTSQEEISDVKQLPDVKITEGNNPDVTDSEISSSIKEVEPKTADDCVKNSFNVNDNVEKITSNASEISNIFDIPEDSSKALKKVNVDDIFGDEEEEITVEKKQENNLEVKVQKESIKNIDKSIDNQSVIEPKLIKPKALKGPLMPGINPAELRSSLGKLRETHIPSVIKGKSPSAPVNSNITKEFNPKISDSIKQNIQAEKNVSKDPFNIFDDDSEEDADDDLFGAKKKTEEIKPQEISEVKDRNNSVADHKSHTSTENENAEVKKSPAIKENMIKQSSANLSQLSFNDLLSSPKKFSSQAKGSDIVNSPPVRVNANQNPLIKTPEEIDTGKESEKMKKSALFSDDDENDSLFGEDSSNKSKISATVDAILQSDSLKSPPVSKSKTNNRSLFSDDGEDLFSGANNPPKENISSKKISSSTVSKVNETQTKNIPKKSVLFADEDENEELFGGAVSSSKVESKKARSSTPQKPNETKKEFEDPLTGIFS